MKQGIRIRALMLLNIFLLGIGLVQCQDYSSFGEIWDFDIGDVFHFREEDGDGNNGYMRIENIEILDKTYTQDSSSVNYFQFVRRETVMSYYPYYLFEEYYEYLTKEHLDSIFYADSVYTNANYNYRKQSYYDISQLPYLIQYGHYVDGCGLAFQYKNKVSQTLYWRGLIYYKKGNEEWGTPHILVGVDDQDKLTDKPITYPNPFTTSTTIECEITRLSHIQLTIYNSIGEVVYKAENRLMSVGKHSFIWSAESLPEGLYYAVLRSEQGVSVVKMVKQ